MKNQLTPNKFMAASALLLAAALLAAPTDVAATDYPAEDASALSNIVLRVGDTFTLPALGANDTLYYHTNAVVSLDASASATVFTALEPGCSFIRLTLVSDDATTTCSTRRSS